MALKRGFSLLKSSVMTLLQSPSILYPYAIVGILQVFFVERMPKLSFKKYVNLVVCGGQRQ